MSALHWTVSPFVLHARGYEVSGGFAARLPYVAVLTVTLLGAGRAYVGAAINRTGAKFSMCDMQAIADMLHETHGCHTVLLERHGKMMEWSIQDILDGKGRSTEARRWWHMRPNVGGKAGPTAADQA